MSTRLLSSLCALFLVVGLVAPAPAQQEPPTPPASLLVKTVPGLSAEQQADVVARNGGVIRSVVPALRLYVVDVAAEELAETLARYETDAQVERIEENKVRVSEAIPNDPLYLDQWALPQIGWDHVFGTFTPAGTATVAVLDTGIDRHHPELADKVVPGISLLDGSDGRTDPSGHGTALAGIIAALTDTVPGDGIAGIGWAGVRVMPVTVLNADGEGQDGDIIAGVIWAADHGADVILMAFSNPGFSPSLQEAIDYAWAKGVVLVASTGNHGSDTPRFPAGDRGVMGVAATDQADRMASWSSHGQAAFIAAPGVDIQTIDIGDAYAVFSGTSTSAAIVAGSAALLKAADPTLQNGVIVYRLASTADPAGTQEQTGNGRVNLARALASTAMESIQPAGADPVGEGGPFVGPYTADACTLQTVVVGVQSPLSPAPGATVTFNVAVTKSGGACTVNSLNVTGLPAGASVVGFSSSSQNFVAPQTINFSGNPNTENVTLTIATLTSTQVGSHSFTVTASGPTAGGQSIGAARSGAGTLTLKRTTTTMLSCSPSTVSVGTLTSCTATVTDTQAGGTASTPSGTVTFASDASGSLSPTSCTLSGGTCSVDYTPSAIGDGSHGLTASYGGSMTHAVSSGTTSVTVVNTVALIFDAKRSDTTSLTDVPAATTVVKVTIGAGAEVSVTRGELPKTFSVVPGTNVSYSYESPLAAGAATKQYRWSATAGAATTQAGSFAMPSTASAVTATYLAQFKLTLATSPAGVGGVGNPSASPAGDGGFYDAGTSVTVSALALVDIVAGSSRYKFTHWSDDASGMTTSVGVTMDAPKSVTANYVTQFRVTFAQVGIGTDTETNTVVTVDGVPQARGDLPFSTFVDSGAPVTYAYASPVATTSPTKQYRWNTTSGLAQTLQSNTFTVTAAGTVTGYYKTQFQVTFTNTGLGADATGTLLTLNASAKPVPSFSAFFDEGSALTFAYSNPVASSTTGKQYRLTSVDTTSPLTVNAATTVTAAYIAQYRVTFDQAGITLATGNNTVVSVDAAAKKKADLPFSKFVDENSSVSYSFATPISTDPVSSVQYELGSVSGPSSPFTVTGPVEVTGHYTAANYAIKYLKPLDQTTNGVVVNTGKNGRVIPVKIELFKDGVMLTPTTMPGDVTIRVVGAVCPSGSGVTDPIEEYADAGNSNGNTNLFRWTSDGLIYNLDTKALGLKSNACYRLDVYIGGLGSIYASATTWAVFMPVK